MPFTIYGLHCLILHVHYNVQANWHLEWHLDLLILWALAVTGELSKAEDLLKGLKSRLEEFSSLVCFSVAICHLFYCNYFPLLDILR